MQTTESALGRFVGAVVVTAVAVGHATAGGQTPPITWQQYADDFLPSLNTQNWGLGSDPKMQVKYDSEPIVEWSGALYRFYPSATRPGRFNVILRMTPMRLSLPPNEPPTALEFLIAAIETDEAEKWKAVALGDVVTFRAGLPPTVAAMRADQFPTALALDGPDERIIPFVPVVNLTFVSRGAPK